MQMFFNSSSISYSGKTVFLSIHSSILSLTGKGLFVGKQKVSILEELYELALFGCHLIV